MTSSPPSLTPPPQSSLAPVRRYSWDTVNETQAMLEGSPSSHTNVRHLPSPPTLTSSSSSSSTAEHDSLDDILSKAGRKSSPLNPNHTPRRPSSSYISHRVSLTNAVLRIPSEESRALSMHIPSASSTRPSTPSSLSSPVINNSNNSTLRGSMILYRLAADELRTPSLTSSEHGRLIPPSRIRNSYHGRKNRDSMMSMSGMSISGDSVVSLSSDSKYPISGSGSERGLVPYAYEPDEADDSLLDDDEDGEDWIFEDEYNDARWNEKKRMSSSTDPSSNATHTPTLPKGQTKSPLNRRTLYSSRGFANLFGLALLLVGLLALFIIYPIATFYHDNGRNHRITTNSRINSTGQAEGDGGDVAPTDSNQGGHGVWKIVDRREVDKGPEVDDQRSSFLRFVFASNDSPSNPENDDKRRINRRFTRHYD